MLRSNLKSDYQWPSYFTKPESYLGSSSQQEREKYSKEISEYFEKKWEVPVVVVPSGRAALSLIFKRFGLGRGHRVYAPMWSSFCVWSSIARYANPTCDFRSDLDGVITVHKFGRVHKLSQTHEGLLIEDSCDSVCLGKEALFPNGGPFEVFSLPKIMGAYSGGLIAVKEKRDYDSLIEAQGEFSSINDLQGKLKFEMAMEAAPQLIDWETNEFRNFHLDLTGLKTLSDNLRNFESNSQVIRERLALLKDRVPDIFADSGFRMRLPPALSIEEQFINKEGQSVLRELHIEVKSQIDQPQFEKRFILPLHFGISDSTFESLMGFLK